MSILIKTSNILLTVSLIALMAGCGSMGGPKAVGPALTGAEITSLISGNTIQGPMGAQMYDWYYGPAGRLTGVVGADDDDTGTWIIKGTNTYCHQWIDFFDGVQHCYEWYKVQRSGEYVMKNVDVDHAGDIPVWKVMKGNPYKM